MARLNLAGSSKINAARASHSSRMPRGFPVLPFVTAVRRNDRFGPTALAVSAAFAEASCRSVILRSRARNRCGGQQPVLLRGARGGGGRNARATPPRMRAILDCPPALHPQESPVIARLPQSFGRPRNATFSLSLTFRQIVAARNIKNSLTCAEAVEDVTSLWKSEEK